MSELVSKDPDLALQALEKENRKFIYHVVGFITGALDLNNSMQDDAPTKHYIDGITIHSDIVVNKPWKPENCIDKNIHYQMRPERLQRLNHMQEVFMF